MQCLIALTLASTRWPLPTRIAPQTKVHRERDIQIRRGQGRNDTVDSMSGIVSAIRQMPMRSVIDLVARR